MRDYVYAYTNGNISKTAPVRVQFASAVIKSDAIGSDASQYISFQPNIKGQAVWEDDRTIRFEPKEYLPSGQAFVGKVNIAKLYEKVPAEAASFEFDFSTKIQSFDINFAGLQTPVFNEPTKQDYTGVLYTADVATANQVEPVLSATYNGQKLPIQWSHADNGMTHNFSIKNIQRINTASTLKIAWNGAGINPNKRGEKIINLPEAGKFTLLESQVIQGEEQYILLNFSDMLLSGQDLNGLITIQNAGEMRFITDGNNVRAYPSQRLNGKYTVQIEPSVRNYNSTQLNAPNRWSVTFEDMKPQLRLVGDGVILPNSEGLIFPFEAVNLDYADIEIIKIYNNNILQFLQTNALDGEYELQRVGKIILQKRLSLDKLNPTANKASWTRYGIDLATLIDKDPFALYQVRLAMRKEYSGLSCGNSQQEKNLLPAFEEQKDDNGEFVSITGYNYYGYHNDDYYGEGGYNWEDRDNPCEPEYFNDERQIRRNIMASNLGITAKLGKDNSVFVAVADIVSTKSLSGVKVDFFDNVNQLIGTATTCSDGTLMTTLQRPPAVAVATVNNQKGYVRMNDAETLSLARYDVQGEVIQRGVKGFIYGERGVWRPGDSLYLHFILEDKENKLPENYPITFELNDARGHLYYKTATAKNTNNVYPLWVATAATAATGNWLAKVKVGGATFTKTLKVETIKPNRLKINLDFGNRKELAADEGINGNLQVSWLHGSPANGIKTKVEIQAKAVKTEFNNVKDKTWIFDDPARSFQPEPQTIFDGVLDANGTARVHAKVNNATTVPGKVQLNFKTRAFEKGGDFSTDNFSMMYHPYNTYVGVRLPSDRYGEKRMDIDKNGKIDVMAVDKQGNPLSNKRLTVGLYKVDWRWWWDVGYDNISQFNEATMLGAIEQTTLTTNSNGVAQWTTKVDQWGRYLVRVCDQNSGHCTGDFFYAGYPWYDEGNAGINREQKKYASMLSFTASKKEYKISEEVVLQIPSNENARALITIENGTKVTQHYWVDFKKGDNTFRFKATPEMAPTVYVHASLLQPHGQTKNDLPIRMYGVVPVKIDDPNTRLTPELTMPSELKPEHDFQVSVNEKNGKPMAYTIAVVDEGLLDITRFKTPNPWDAFYAREALGVKTWDVYDFVLGAYGAELERILGIGGDGFYPKAKNAEKVNRFKPVVLHLGPFYLKKGEKASHKLTMPNYVGSVRVMVVAADNGSYGNAEKTVPVRQAVMTLATLPRVLSPGEKLQLPINVFVMKEGVKSVNISVTETSGLVNIVGDKSKNMSFAKIGDAVAYFDLQIPNRTGTAKFKITASGGGETATQDIEIAIRNPNPYITNVTESIIQPNEAWNAAFTNFGTDGSNTHVLEISSIPPINLGKHLQWLLQYPHGCAEQTTSTAFPQLYLDKLMRLDDKRKAQTVTNIKAAIEKLRSFQTSEGGFGYWQGAPDADSWVSSYIGHFLLEAQGAGYTVPNNVIEKWAKFQKRKAADWTFKKEQDYYYFNNDLMQAYRLFTLALAKQPDLASMNRLRETKDISLQSNWRLAAAYALVGKQEIAKSIVNALPNTVQPYNELSYTYGCDERDEAMILEALVYMNNKTQAASVAQRISKALSGNQWLSTQATSYLLLAMSKFATTNQIQNKFTFSYQQGAGAVINAGSDNPLMQISLSANAGTKCNVKNTSKGILYARIISTGQPVVGDTTSMRDYANQLNLSVQYKNAQGAVVNPDKLPQRADILVEVTVTNIGNRRYEELALQTVFPAGWEITNNRMNNVGTSENSYFNYQDFRDDRVYTYFNLSAGESRVFKFQTTAAYAGNYFMPPITCEAMYDNTISARRAGRWVTISKN